MKTILVVDDEFDLAATLQAILEGEGYRVETCSNGREALERLRGAPRPDLVLTE
jgi:CheY-like chemotaxis protein